MVNTAAQNIPAGRVLIDPESLERYRHDEAEWAPHGMPLAVVRPKDTAEVRDVVRHCISHGVPLVARGAGTGLSGGANAVDGAIMVSFEDMDQIIRIDPDERLAVVRPGVVNDDLRAACARVGMWYPPDPASSPWSTIGGNVATNAGGMCCVKYGVTRDYVLGLEIVDGRGEIVRLGRQTAKGVAGYDLCGLMVGSEGTLGVITEITVRLRPARPVERTIAGYFDSVVAAGEAVSAITAAGVIPSALELVDRHCLAAVDAWRNMGLSADADVVLLGRVDTPGAEGDAEAALIRDCFERAGATWAAQSTDQQEADALFDARRLAYPALERLGPVLTEDVCVPRAAVPEMLARIEKSAARHDVLIANIAHAGDGNLHPLIITQPGDDAARARAQLAFDDILDDAIALGGTVTGEHGVGLLKMRGMDKEMGPAALSMQRAVKAALDPHGILNPGKVVARADAG
ncbi:FAD-binding oxidoreductase [Streptomyces tsukubensis]|uniref:FAD-binding oxidoreductase n=1 Tax=Streptomyces tsukubensis TaxID=83656 RepID=A0A1V4A1D8_9ACTN|nr:FAD-linked oxidase C-terminal domain-containing protein [Streptomyces tsukubensis]OON72200.1 FAD-binding oxidoreductase [Streptomyces tsukubensis]QFR97107.1 FAD-binding protein [Streptomyces tsukubensis]